MEFDMNMIWSVAIIVGTVAFAIGMRYLSKTLAEEKGINLSQELLEIIKWFDLSVDFVKEFNLPYEDKIADIYDIVNNCCYFAVEIMDETNFDEMMAETIEYAKDLAEDFEIELTESRIKLITALIKLALNEKIDAYIV